MHAITESRIVHSYDVVMHRVRCGETRPDHSTKHPSGVTCATCRELLLSSTRGAPRLDVAHDATLDG